MRNPYESSRGHIVKIWKSPEMFLGDAGAIEIASEISKHTDWVSIQLDWHQIGPVGAEKLVSAIQENHLQCFSLSGNPIGNAGAIHFANSLKTPSFKLERLHLNRCRITAEGAVTLAESLKINKALKILDLRDNNIGDTGAIALAEAIKHNQSLEKIFLDANHISDIGAIALAQAIRHNRHLKEIFLDGNDISDKFAIELALAIKENTGLEYISLDGNHISNTGAIALAQAIRHNPHLKEIYLDGNDISKIHTEALEKAIDKNKALSAMAGCARGVPKPPTNITTYGMWNKNTTIVGVILAADVLANLTGYFIGGALSTFLFSPPVVILSVLIALAALSYQVVGKELKF